MWNEECGRLDGGWRAGTSSGCGPNRANQKRNENTRRLKLIWRRYER